MGASVVPFTAFLPHHSTAETELKKSLVELRTALALLQGMAEQMESSGGQLANAEQVDASMDAIAQWLSLEMARLSLTGGDT